LLNAVAVPVNLVIGDNDMASDPTGLNPHDQVVYRDQIVGTPLSTNQIADGATITVNRSGRLNYASRTDTVGVLSIDQGRVIASTGNLSIARATIAGGTIDPGTGTITLTANVSNSADSPAHTVEIQPSPIVSVIGPASVSTQSNNNSTINLANGFRTFVTGQGTNSNIEGPNLYDMVINANINGGGTLGRFEKQGPGGVRINGVNTNLTGGSEQQRITVPNTVTRFAINFGGAQSDVMNYLDSAAIVQAKLEAMAGIGTGNVTVTLDTSVATQRTFNINFTNVLAGYDIPVATYQVISTGSSETQTISFANTPSGTFRLSYGNLTSGPIDYTNGNEVQRITRVGNNVPVTFSFNGANAAAITLSTATTNTQIQTNLNTIAALTGRVTVTGNAGGPWTVTFGGTLANTNVNQIGVNNANAFVDTINNGGTLANLGANIQAALNTMLGTGNATVTANSLSLVTVTFGNGQLANANVQQLVASAMSTSGNALVNAPGTVFNDGIGNSTQYIRLGGDGGGPNDTVQITYNGFTSGNKLPFVAGTSPTAAQVQAELNLNEALRDNVLVIGRDGGPFTIIFTNALTSSQVAPIAITLSGGVTGIASTSPSSRLPTSEVQRLTFNSAVTTGQFTLSYVPPGTTAAAAMTTPPITFSPNSVTMAKAIQDALNAPTFFGPNSVVVTPVNPPPAANTSYVITFRGRMANADVAQITGTGVTFNAPVTAANFVTGSTSFEGVGNEVQTLQFNNIVPGNGAGGQVLLSYNGVTPKIAGVDQPITWIPSSTTVTPIADTAPALPTSAAVEANLNLIPELAGNVTVIGKDGGPFSVIFNGALVNKNVLPRSTLVTGSEVQRLRTTGGGIAEGQTSTFRLSMGSLKTGVISVDPNVDSSAAMATKIQDALNAMINANNPFFGTNSVTVTPTTSSTLIAPRTGLFNFDFYIKFGG
jgi:hypothetical protein